MLLTLIFRQGDIRETLYCGDYYLHYHNRDGSSIVFDLHRQHLISIHPSIRLYVCTDDGRTEVDNFHQPCALRNIGPRPHISFAHLNRKSDRITPSHSATDVALNGFQLAVLRDLQPKNAQNNHRDDIRNPYPQPTPNHTTAQQIFPK